MRQSQLFTKTRKDFPKDEEAVSAKLLIRAGFIFKNSAGVYTFLPLGWRVIQKIIDIVRYEMDAIYGEECLMPALVEKKYWQATGRWDIDIGFETKGKKDEESNFMLGWSHEDLLAFMAARFINSYKDLPKAIYQFQTKFRNEPRAKSGILRGREFLMKDLYSFHASEEDLWRFYEIVKNAYFRIFERCGLKTVYTLAGGGAFTISNTNEFQVLAGIGEDKILVCDHCEYAENSEISKLKTEDKCPKCLASRDPAKLYSIGKVREKRAIEVGNIFPLGTKYSEAFDLKYTDKNGNKKPVVMGSYGIGIGRLMGTIVEIYNDEKGIIWPESVAPFRVHLIRIGESEKLRNLADRIYSGFARSREARKDGQKAEVEVLYDDRDDISAGEKFADADLIGIPFRAVISDKTGDEVEVKKRDENKTKLVSVKEFINARLF